MEGEFLTSILIIKILYIHSSQELFFKTHSSPMQYNNTVVYLKDVDPSHLQLLLTYMYRGEVDVSENNLTEFLKTASGNGT